MARPLDRPVAIDAMGGDNAPEEIIEGARIARDELGIPVVLVGLPEIAELAGDLELITASEVIGMDDDPGASVRRRKDSSVVRAAEQVRDGNASAMVSAGNTGAAMASALLRMGRIRGVSRPAIAIPVPSLAGHVTVLLDVGANSVVQPAWLVQFAQMGVVYSRERYGVSSARVGLLSIGEEATKGSALVKEANKLMVEADWEPFSSHFVGNVEGRDLMEDVADVVATDGFTGNVVLKTLEGSMRALRGAFDEIFDEDDASRAARAAIAEPVDELYRTIDWTNTGGAILLGVDGVCIISHGSSERRAISNAVALAADMAHAGLVDEVKRVIDITRE